jgi:hypothetical protein
MPPIVVNLLMYCKPSTEFGVSVADAEAWFLDVEHIMRKETRREMAERQMRRSRVILARPRAFTRQWKSTGTLMTVAKTLLAPFNTKFNRTGERMDRENSCLLAKIEMDNRSVERRRFVEWTFDRELDQIECCLASFDRCSPTADIIEARKLIALLSTLNNAPERDAAFPRFLGHDMHWWVDCISLVEDGERRLKDMGIDAAIDAWREAEHDWNWYRGVCVERA